MFDAKKSITFAIVGFGLVVLGASSACSSSSSCTYTKACPKDPDPTADQIKAAEDKCKANETAYAGQPCYAEAKSYGDCSKGAIVCSAAGTTDGTATLAKIASSCSTQVKAAQDCCVKNPTSKVCTG
jgi:hypothetical protein